MEEERLKRRTIQRTDRAWRQREATKERAWRGDEKRARGKKERKHPVGDESERERGEARNEREEKSFVMGAFKTTKIHSCCRAELSRGFGSSEQELIEGARFISNFVVNICKIRIYEKINNYVTHFS